MKTYTCLECGKNYESKECVDSNKCPDCQCSVKASGLSILLLSAFIYLILPMGTPDFVIFSLPTLVAFIGVYRLIKQLRIKLKKK